MTITRVKLENFTVFESLDLEPSPGINVLVGANGTGKTHFMKVCYAACDISKTEESFAEKLAGVFLPSGQRSQKLERLVNRIGGSEVALLTVFRGNSLLDVSLPYHLFGRAIVKDQSKDWSNLPVECVYIPAKEILSNAPGFRSLYASREVHFEEVYLDILDRAYLPALRNQIDNVPIGLLDKLEAEIGGTVTIKGEEFFLTDKLGDLEFTLLAEGLRKLGLMWLLIRNGTLKPGTVLFWDEPETNLNPKLYGVVIHVLLELQRLGVQVFLATHDYVILREIDLQAKEGDQVAFHSLYHTEEGQITCHTTDKFREIHPNAIMEAFDSIYDREIKRNLAGLV